jgi:ketosteroid isomerase-like protein
VADHVGVAERFFAAIAAGDAGAVRAACAPDAELVVNGAPETTMPVDVMAGRVAEIARHIPDFRYEDVRCEATASGFVREHVMCGTSPAGAAFAAPACCVGRVASGRLTRIDEYADPAKLAELGLPEE